MTCDRLFRVTDSDGDYLEAIDVGGFGEPMLAVEVRQDGDFAVMNLNVANAAALAEYLMAFATPVITIEAEPKTGCNGASGEVRH